MRRFLGAITFFILVASYMMAPGLALAAPLQLGAPIEVVRTAFADTHEVHGPSRRVLEVLGPQFAGLVWRKADFTFDPNDHLASVTLSITNESFDRVETRMAGALAQVDAAPPGYEGLAQDPEGDVQIRICEANDGSITVTFERRAV